ncbi:MAG TPA: cupin domain-containing protein, partial [Rhizomicrobium sp.]|nr:cupin domain-containing protein [Rhizomicrobium sp.]
AHTGVAHSLINNTGRDARVFVMSQAFPRAMKVANPLDPSDAILKKMDMHWADAPRRKLGPNKGKPGDESGRKRGRPAFVTHWREILDDKPGRYPDSDEDQGIDARFGLKARFSRIGIHLEVLKPGRRTSWPHAERDEDEFVYVVSGDVDAWNDGYITSLGEGDFIGWRSGTGLTHAILNNSDRDAILLIGGEASRTRNQFWYPFHPKRNKEVGALYWADHPVPKLGPHDGMPDALRARVPKAARKSAVAANERARLLAKPKSRT